MRMVEAMLVMESGRKGFMVAFERVEGSVLVSDHFPEVRNGEQPIETEEEAWAMARLFASKTTKRCVNVYVIRSEDFTPVHGHLERMIENR